MTKLNDIKTESVCDLCNELVSCAGCFTPAVLYFLAQVPHFDRRWKDQWMCPVYVLINIPLSPSRQRGAGKMGWGSQGNSKGSWMTGALKNLEQNWIGLCGGPESLAVPQPVGMKYDSTGWTWSPYSDDYLLFQWVTKIKPRKSVVETWK